MLRYPGVFMVFAVLLIHDGAVDAYNLLLVPQSMTSHVMMFGRLGQALVNEGHEVSIVIPNNMNIPNWLPESGIDIHTYQGVGDEPIIGSKACSQLLLDARFTTSKIEFFQLMFQMDGIVVPILINECKNLMDDVELRNILVGKKFDFAVSDSVSLQCVMNYPVSLGLDYFVLSIPSFPWLYRIPELPSFVPDVLSSEFTDEMDFTQRLENTMIFIMGLWFFNTTNPLDMTQYHPGQAVPDLRELESRALLWFVFDDISLAYPRPFMPNMISVADIMLQPASKLPEDFQTFLDEAAEGVILVSFGSLFEFVPEDTLVKFCDAFAKVPQKIIWKMKMELPCSQRLEGKVMIVPWMPQNDLLAHPNVQLFITHCGLNSMIEALYHSKPMLGFPLSLDQPYNGALLKHHGYGDIMDIRDFTADGVIKSIADILHSEDIRANVIRGSSLIRDKPEQPGKRIAFWVDHVAKYGAQHLRTAAFDLSISEFLLLDVLCVILGAVILLIVLVVCLLCCVWKCARRCCCKSKATKTKRD